MHRPTPPQPAPPPKPDPLDEAMAKVLRQDAREMAQGDRRFELMLALADYRERSAA